MGQTKFTVESPLSQNKLQSWMENNSRIHYVVPWDILPIFLSKQEGEEKKKTARDGAFQMPKAKVHVM